MYRPYQNIEIIMHFEHYKHIFQFFKFLKLHVERDREREGESLKILMGTSVVEFVSCRVLCLQPTFK